MLQYEVFILGELLTKCYLAWDKESKKAVVIDPADEGVGLTEEVAKRQLALVGILSTHGHFDHVMGALDLKLIYQVPFYCSSKDKFLLKRQRETAWYFLGREIETPNFKKIDVDLDKIKTIEIGGEKLEVIKTPGHTPGGVSFYNPSCQLVFSGDTLFENGIGRTDLSYSRHSDLEASIKKLNKYLISGAKLLPGH